MIGAQASSEQLEKILSYIDIGKQEGAEVLIGGERNSLRELLAAITSSPPCSRATTGCAFSRRRSSGRSFRSRLPRPTKRRSRSPMTRSTASARACGAATSTDATAWPRDPGGPGLDQLLPRLSGACSLRWVQAVRDRAREAQDDARPLSADQEHAGQLQPEEARLLLTGCRHDGGAGLSLRRHLAREEKTMERLAAVAHTNRVLKAIIGNGAASSPIVASWRRSGALHALDPANVARSWRLSSPEVAAARERLGRLLHVAQPSLERLFFAVGGVGCSVMLADRDGVILERRGAPADELGLRRRRPVDRRRLEREIRGHERSRYLSFRTARGDDRPRSAFLRPQFRALLHQRADLRREWRTRRLGRIRPPNSRPVSWS